MFEKFTIAVSNNEQQRLKRRLEDLRWPDTLDPDSWEWGTSSNYLRDLTSYWLEKFHWSEQEAKLNEFPQFVCAVGGYRVHFVHSKGRGRRLPILLIHGWPGSFWEMHKIIPLLTEYDFDVVVPSLPGYGFSDRPGERGMSPVKIASLFAQLMQALGYSRYVVQGGDWGASIATWMGLNHSSNIAAIHLNYIPGSYKPAYLPEELKDDERDFIKSREEWFRLEGGYSHIQATKPQTVAYGLNDSPAALAAWIVEKFKSWSDCNGDVERRFTKEELLTNISIYWFTQTIHSSMRLYYEAQRTPVVFEKGSRVEVPCMIARLPKEIPMPPRSWVERGYNVQSWTEFKSGGHFAALEEPAALAGDIRGSTENLR